MTNVISADSGQDKHYKHTGFGSTITDSYSSPSIYPRGITWDGTNVISVDASADKHYKHTGFGSTITDSYSSPWTYPKGITWDGTNVISADSGQDKHYKHTGFGSTITDSYSSPSTDPSGITWDGTNVISADSGQDKHYKHSGFSDTITDSYASPSTSPMGITWDGRYSGVTEKNSSDTGSGVDVMATLAVVIPTGHLLDSMDATTGWQAQGGVTNITVNTTTKKEGTGALNLIKNDDGDTDAYIEKAISSTNLTSKYVKVWLYLKDTATVAKIERAQIYLYDASNNYRAWDITDLAIGWNLIIADTESTPDYQSGTPGNLSAITKIELDVDTNQAADLYAEGDVIADYYHYSGFEISDSGSGVDISSDIQAAVVGGETGAGMDVILESLASRLESETGGGMDAILESLASRLESETGAGIDALLDLFKGMAKYGSETGVGADAISSELADLSQLDLGSGMDELVEHLVAILGSEIGASAEEEMIGLANTETGTGVDALSLLLAELAKSDLGIGEDKAIALLAELTGSDSGTGIEDATKLIWVSYMMLKLLQAKGLNLELSQKERKKIASSIIYLWLSYSSGRG